MTVLVPPYVQAGAGDQVVEELTRRRDDVDVVRAATDDEMLAAAPDADVVVTGRLPPELLAAAENLEWVQALSAGVDFFDHAALEDRDIALTTASGVHAKPIGQHVLGALLFFERRFDRAVAQQRRHEWSRYTGRELGDRTVGIVGVGAIGSAVADYCATFGTRCLGVKRDPSEAPNTVDAAYSPSELDRVLAASDYLVLSCPLTDDTRGLIDASALERLPDHAVVCNVARGAVVDQSALVTALREDAIRGAALDVFEDEPLPEDSPLWDRDDVLVTPHIAGSTPHYWERAVELFLDNFDRYRAGDPLQNRVV